MLTSCPRRPVMAPAISAALVLASVQICSALNVAVTTPQPVMTPYGVQEVIHKLLLTGSADFHMPLSSHGLRSQVC